MNGNRQTMRAARSLAACRANSGHQGSASPSSGNGITPQMPGLSFTARNTSTGERCNVIGVAEPK